jgi:hypothetical protein
MVHIILLLSILWELASKNVIFFSASVVVPNIPKRKPSPVCEVDELDPEEDDEYRLFMDQLDQGMLHHACF